MKNLLKKKREKNRESNSEKETSIRKYLYETIIEELEEIPDIPIRRVLHAIFEIVYFSRYGRREEGISLLEKLWEAIVKELVAILIAFFAFNIISNLIHPEQNFLGIVYSQIIGESIQMYSTEMIVNIGAFITLLLLFLIAHNRKKEAEKRREEEINKEIKQNLEHQVPHVIEELKKSLSIDSEKGGEKERVQKKGEKEEKRNKQKF